MSVLTLPPLNPVLARELKQRMRGRLTWVVVTGYLALLALILRFVYLGASQSIGGTNFADPLASASVGRSIFHWLLFFMLMLVCFIVPGLTASAISGERERQTLVSLQVTLLRPRSIVLGKLLASLAFTSFLVVASLPLLSVPFLVGGVSVSEVLKGVVMVLATAVVLACLAVACSALFRRTQAATVIAYGLTAALTIGTFIVYGGQRAMDGPVDKASPGILALNPFVATADVVEGRSESSSLESPFTALVDLVRPDMLGFVPGMEGAVDVGGGFGIARGGPAIQFPPGPMRPVPTVAIAPPAPAPAANAAPATTAPAAATLDFAPAPDLDLPTDTTIPLDVSASDDPVIIGPGVVEGRVFVDDGIGFQVDPFTQEEFRRPRAEVAGFRLWVVWLVGSAVLVGLALALAVRRVSLPSARDSS
jgi:ABC-type transport system involved in multi-copper enzyme maturation permease subunit